jgi:hypothetical protein
MVLRDHANNSLCLDLVCRASHFVLLRWPPILAASDVDG